MWTIVLHLVSLEWIISDQTTLNNSIDLFGQTCWKISNHECLFTIINWTLCLAFKGVKHTVPTGVLYDIGYNVLGVCVHSSFFLLLSFSVGTREADSSETSSCPTESARGVQERPLPASGTKTEAADGGMSPWRPWKGVGGVVEGIGGGVHALGLQGASMTLPFKEADGINSIGQLHFH